MAGAGKYTAETLAFRAGVPLRTVRFYVQEKLIDPPLSRGRGSNFTEYHLAQLQQARTLHNAGFALFPSPQLVLKLTWQKVINDDPLGARSDSLLGGVGFFF